jgi:hypothetical protein
MTAVELIISLVSAIRKSNSIENGRVVRLAALQPKKKESKGKTIQRLDK